VREPYGLSLCGVSLAFVRPFGELFSCRSCPDLSRLREAGEHGELTGDERMVGADQCQTGRRNWGAAYGLLDHRLLVGRTLDRA
jgi:hypothetical protein